MSILFIICLSIYAKSLQTQVLLSNVVEVIYMPRLL